MSKIDELHSIAQMLKGKRSEEILDALFFLNSPIEDYVDKDRFKVENLKKNHMKFDVFLDTYKRKSLVDYEEQRIRALAKINNTENIVDRFLIAINEAAEIQEGIHGINYNNMYKSCCQVMFMIEVCNNMLVQGATLTEISKYVPGSQLGDIYHLATDHLGIEIEPTDEEREEITRYDQTLESQSDEKVRFCDIMGWIYPKGIPHKVSDGVSWSIDGKDVYDVYTIACVFSECRLMFPYYYDDKTNPTYEKTFDKLLEKVMLTPDKISFDGLRESYSAQEWNLINHLREKMINAR